MFRYLALALCLPFYLLAPLQSAAQLPDFTDLVEKQGPAVVNVSAKKTARNSLAQQFPELDESHPLYDFFRRMQPNQGVPETQPESLGSGFIISADGYILTNAHVIEDGEEVTVRLTDKREFKAKVIGADKRTDVALIKIEAARLPTVRFGDPNRLKVGEWVVAIGSPFGFENTVTAGIVSAKGRSFPMEGFVPFIQTDVAVNMGNSGGPLFNLRGEVVGINSRLVSTTGGYIGLSFAIPIDVANEVAQQLRATGRVTRGRIGVGIQPITKELADGFGLAKPQGALVNSVVKGSPAGAAGIQEGDVILRFDGKEVTAPDDLQRLVGNTKPGTKVVVQVWRNKVARELQLSVVELIEDRAVPNPRSSKPQPTQFGMGLADLTDAQKKEFKVEGGVFVDSAQGAAARAGVRRGDVILGVNNQDVKSVEQFRQLMVGVEKGRIVALLVRRGANALYIPFRADNG